MTKKRKPTKDELRPPQEVPKEQVEDMDGELDLEDEVNEDDDTLFDTMDFKGGDDGDMLLDEPDEDELEELDDDLVNDSLALRQAIENGAGIGMAPDYAMSTNPKVKQVLRDEQMPTLDSYLVYPEEMRSVARVQVFRDFLVSKAQRWDF